MPLIILEGLDKSGKSVTANILHERYNSIIIKKQYAPDLYPIDFGKASNYDWQAIFDRVILANPDTLFIADRSFMTQTLYQIAFGNGQSAITPEQIDMFNKYCKVLQSIPHTVLYCHSKRYELDSMVTTITKHRAMHKLYANSLGRLQTAGMNVLQLDMDDNAMHQRLTDLYDYLEQTINISKFKKR